MENGEWLPTFPRVGSTTLSLERKTLEWMYRHGS
jgi:hypothetical protein